MLKIDYSELLEKLEILFPNAGCELIYHNIYELTVAVMISAQTTDKKVNTVTSELFRKYPDISSLSQANIVEVEQIIKSIGLAKTKASNMIKFAKMVINEFNGDIPSTLEELTTLPGIGRKTANVVLSEGYKIQRIAVDTHVERTSKRLNLSNVDSSVLQVEKDLMDYFPEDKWHRAHHLLLFFGRYMCKSQNPDCINCPFKQHCIKQKSV